MSKETSGIEVTRMHRLNSDSNIKAFVDVSFGGEFMVKGLKVIEGQNGRFVSMPSEKGKDGKWYDKAHPLTKEFREFLNGVVMEAYEKA